MQTVLSIVDERIMGIVKNDFQLINKNIHTITENVLPVKLVINNTLSARVLKAFLEIHAISPNPKYAMWKLWFNSFPLTREYRPNFSFPIKNEQHDIFLYDVTPIMNRDLNKKTHKLVIKNTGSVPINVSYAFLVVQLETDKAETHHKYEINIKECKESLPCTFQLSSCNPQARNQTRINGYITNAPMEIYIEANKWRKQIFNPTQIVDLTIEECLESKISVRPVSTSNTMYTFSHHSYSSIYERPLIDLKVAKKGDKLAEIYVEIKNDGKVAANNVMMIGIMHGNPVFSKKIDKINSGEIFSDTILLEKPKEPATLTIRVIWNEYGELFFREAKTTI